MSRPTKKRGGYTMEAVEFRGGDYQKPKPIWPRWADAALVEAIAADLRDGVSEVAASLRAGLSRRTVSVWLTRWWAAVDRSTADDEQKGPPEETAFVQAVAPIARALGDWIADMERKAQRGGDGSSGAMWALPRRVQDVYGNAQTVTVDAPDAGKEAAALLAALAPPRSE